MREAAKREDDPEGAEGESETEARPEVGAMSPEMRRLIQIYVDRDSDETWDPDAFARRSSSAA